MESRYVPVSGVGLLQATEARARDRACRQTEAAAERGAPPPLPPTGILSLYLGEAPCALGRAVLCWAEKLRLNTLFCLFRPLASMLFCLLSVPSGGEGCPEDREPHARGRGAWSLGFVEAVIAASSRLCNGDNTLEYYYRTLLAWHTTVHLGRRAAVGSGRGSRE